MRASGKATRLLKLIEPPETFAETFEFEQEIETIEPLLFILRRFLQALTLRLGALYHVAKELQLEIVFSDKRSYAHRFKIPEPSNNVEVLFRMLHTHLENFTSEAPIVAVSLTRGSGQARATAGKFIRNRAARSDAAFGNARAADWFVRRGTRRHARARGYAPAGRVSDGAVRLAIGGSRAGTAAVAIVRACGVFVRHRLCATTDVDDAVDQAGPFLASGHWWDEKAWSRAEWDLQLADGTLCRCHQHAQGWAMDGIYD